MGSRPGEGREKVRVGSAVSHREMGGEREGWREEGGKYNYGRRLPGRERERERGSSPLR